MYTKLKNALVFANSNAYFYKIFYSINDLYIMKKYFLSIFAVLFIANLSYSQLPNQNTYLFAQVDQYQSYSALWGYKAPDSREYAILGCNTGTSFIDITDSGNVRQVDFVTGITNNWREMKTYSHYAYVVSEATNSGLQIIDLQYLPDSVVLVKTWSYAGYTKTHSIQQSGSYLYLNGGNSAANGGVTVVDVSDPVNPVKMGQWTTEYVHDCRILNDTIWASNIYTGETSIINATNKNSLDFVRTWRSYPTSEVSTHNSAFTTDRKYCYTTNEISSPNGRLNIWNIEDVNNITFIREWLPTGISTSIVHNVEIYGNLAVIAHYRAGIRILDITNGSNPTEVAWYDTYPQSNSASYSGCWGVYMFPSGKIIGSDMSGGLIVIKTLNVLTGVSNNYVNSIPEKFSLDQNFPNPFNPSTTIKFNLKDNSKIKLSLYDIAGIKIADLINDNRDAGSYEFNFDAARYNLSSGTYFYSLEGNDINGNFTDTKKMILIK
ncbi:MAG TPA: choice-of-anchor B family protein [Ignavibacteria bacterium]|nr:choice-of-anchor B family protein [Ignavibacteria bacterium]